MRKSTSAQAILLLQQILDRFLTRCYWDGGDKAESGGFVLLESRRPLSEIKSRSTPPVRNFKSAFVGLDVQKVTNIFWDLIGAVHEQRALFATHVFVVLDEQTAADGRTCMLISDSTGEGEARRCEFEALMYHLYVLEMLMMDLPQLCGPDEVLTAAMMGEDEKSWKAERGAKEGKSWSKKPQASSHREGSTE